MYNGIRGLFDPIIMKSVLQEELSLLKKIRETVDTKKVLDSINKRHFTIKDVGISSRLLNHWEKSGLLMESYEEKKWKVYNLIEYTWLNVIMEMRRFNLSLEIIRKAKHALCFDFSLKDLPEEIDINELILELSPSHQNEKVKQILETIEVQGLLSDFRQNYLELVIMYIVLLKGNYSLLVNLDGDCIPLKMSNYDDYIQMDEFNEFMSGTHLSISITRILSDFLLANEFVLSKKRLAILSDAESEVIRAVRNEEVSSVKIVKNDLNTIDLIEEMHNEKIDKAARLMDIILSHGYQTIEIKTQNGHIVHCTNQIKYKVLD
jgi:DNA-binding transcriptional MerR regulator